MLVKTFGSAVHGIKATTITIEVSVSQGINFFLVGLPDNRASGQCGEGKPATNHLGFRNKWI